MTSPDPCNCEQAQAAEDEVRRLNDIIGNTLYCVSYLADKEAISQEALQTIKASLVPPVCVSEGAKEKPGINQAFPL